MTRPTLELLSSAFIATCLLLGGACEAPAEPSEREWVAQLQQQASSAKLDAQQPESASIVERDAPEAERPAAPIEQAPVLASASKVQPTPSIQPTPIVQPTPAPKARAHDSLRHPSLLPADTPAEHVAAFTRLPLAKRDKAPIAGAGASGIHLDELELGLGWTSSRCEDPSSNFRVGVDERVNLCFRVVHPRAAESVSVEWSREGKVRQVIQVGVTDKHAHLTRAWLPVSKGRVGEWTATVRSEDGTLLGQRSFTIAP